LSNVGDVKAGGAFSLFLKQDGFLWACGSNSYGQFGDGTTTRRSSPIQVIGNVQTIAVGDSHTLLIKSDSTAWACGYNYYGQLGRNITNNGANNLQQVMTGVRAITAGYAHSIFIKSDDSLWACGWNSSGQIGDGTILDRYVPIQIMSGVLSASASFDFNLYLRTDGTVWACGYNAYGTHGTGYNINSITPTSSGFSLFTPTSPPVILPSSEVTIQTAIEIKFTTAPGGHMYDIEKSLNLTDWILVESNIVGTGSEVRRLYSIEGNEQIFYRIRISY
jgi:alpha-tubulin suppressor-like RCC1 family protein